MKLLAFIFEQPSYLYVGLVQHMLGAQWLSGRVIDSRPRGCGFNPRRCHCVLVFEQDTFYPSLVLV